MEADIVQLLGGQILHYFNATAVMMQPCQVVIRKNYFLDEVKKKKKE